MKKITLLFFGLTTLFLSNQVEAQCTTFSGGGPFTNFNTAFGGAPCDDGTGCPFNEITAFEAWADESYLLNNVVIGHTYTFSLCNGPGSGSWPVSFTIIAPSGAIDASGTDADSTCALTWTATEEGMYTIGISEAGVPCDSSTNQSTNNGFPAVTCTDGNSCVECTEIAPPACTTAIAPIDDASGVATVENIDDGDVSREVAFSWDEITGADVYEITFDDVVLGETPNTSVNIFGLEYNTTYTWSISPVNCFGNASGCTTWTFTTEQDPALSADDFNSTSFSVFPNPTKDIVNIKTSLTIDTVIVYDLSGKQVKSIDGQNLRNNSMDISQLKNGVYFLEVTAKNKSQTIKIIKE